MFEVKKAFSILTVSISSRDRSPLPFISDPIFSSVFCYCCACSNLSCCPSHLLLYSSPEVFLNPKPDAQRGSPYSSRTLVPAPTLPCHSCLFSFIIREVRKLISVTQNWSFIKRNNSKTLCSTWTIPESILCPGRTHIILSLSSHYLSLMWQTASKFMTEGDTK